MRISAGEFKGRKIGGKKLFAKKAGGDDLRPTSAKVREAIFDILRGAIDGASFLDLYAGTGTVGIEAASRGACRIVFVESVRSRATAIQTVIENIGLSSKAVVHAEHADMFLKRISRSGECFDIIFVDPPYASGEIGNILLLIDEYGIVNDQGTVLCEHTKKLKLPEAAGDLKLKKQYKYGDTMLGLYRKET
jgi:16S rRNA (guanine966-N2)-methyltransferase